MKSYYRNVQYYQLLIIVAILLVIQKSYGKSIDSDTSSSQIKSTNRFALQLQIKENFQFDDFQGSLISAKYHFNEKHGLRFGIEIYGDFKKSDNIYFFYPDASNSSDPSLKKNDLSILFIFQYLNISSSRYRMRRYIAMGPIIGYGYTYENTAKDLGDDNIAISPNTINRTDYKIILGSLFDLGLEYYINKNIGIMVEYGIKFLYNKQKCDSKRPDYDEFYYEDFQINSDNLKLGISIYF